MANPRWLKWVSQTSMINIYQIWWESTVAVSNNSIHKVPCSTIQTSMIDRLMIRHQSDHHLTLIQIYSYISAACSFKFIYLLIALFVNTMFMSQIVTYLYVNSEGICLLVDNTFHRHINIHGMCVFKNNHITATLKIWGDTLVANPGCLKWVPQTSMINRLKISWYDTR